MDKQVEQVAEVEQEVEQVAELSAFEKFRREYNRSIEGIPSQEIEMRLELLSGLGWRPDDGPLPGIFSNRDAGHRCAWSCNWAGPGGLRYYPVNIYRIEHLTVEQAIYEALDVVFRGQGPELAILLLQHYSGEPDLNYGMWFRYLKDAIEQARMRYPEYTAFWSLDTGSTSGSGRIWRLIERPGYSSKAAMLRSVGYLAGV